MLCFIYAINGQEEYRVVVCICMHTFAGARIYMYEVTLIYTHEHTVV